MDSVEVTIKEWEKATPQSHPQLAGIRLDPESTAGKLAGALTDAGFLRVENGYHGLSLKAQSRVGAIRLGPLRVIIRPKLEADIILPLLRYAYGLRNLHLVGMDNACVSHNPFADLLLTQLVSEVEELVARGLHRRYRERRELLSSPKGRLDFSGMASGHNLTTTSLPCTHYTRSEDCLLNRVLAAGLRFGATCASDEKLAWRLRSFAGIVEEGVTRIRLNWQMLESLQNQMNRLVAAFRPAIKIIELIFAGGGTVTMGDRQVPIPGFLFDMNLFFQNLISRFLRENLPDGHQLEDQVRLGDTFRYEPGFNPLDRRPPVIRPDFLIRNKDGQAVAVLDAKYRDLWSRSLPSEMLYQMAIYALSCNTANRQATILYPCQHPEATEAKIAIRTPTYPKSNQATVVLRPVPLRQLSAAIQSGTAIQQERVRRSLARRLALGE